MKFIIGRILKNIPFLDKIWLSVMEYCNFKYYDKHCTSYKIIPFGDYCLPRFIATINRFKPTIIVANLVDSFTPFTSKTVNKRTITIAGTLIHKGLELKR